MLVRCFIPKNIRVLFLIAKFCSFLEKFKIDRKEQRNVLDIL